MSIVLEQISKRFAGQLVVDDVSLEIPSGELFVLLGASGSGKSTILRLVAGLAAPDRGRILLDGRDMTSVPPQHRGTGFVFQNYSIFRHMSVADNVEFGLRIRRQSSRERRRRREELLDLVGMSGFASRYPEELSGGQQQRVALARALAYQPRVLLLDEPFGALDVKIRMQLRRSLREIQRGLKLTMILVTHDQEEGFEVADRLGVIERGRLLEVGSARALYARPRTLYVGTFLGASNVLVGRAQEGQAHFGPLRLPIPPERPHEDGGLVRLLFRPEEVALSPGAPADAPVLGRGPVVERSVAGPWMRVRVRLPALRGTRQIAPVAGLGDEGLLLDALLPAETVVPEEEVWASLRAWHILEQQRARLLVLTAPRAPSGGLALACALARRMDAHVTALAVDRDARRASDLGAEIERQLREAGVGHTQVLVRAGDAFKEVQARQAESPHDLVVIDERRESARRRPAASLQPLLERAQVPILISKGKRAALQRLLICTAAGEAGKSGVYVGGRLAHALEAAVTVVFVLRGGEQASALERSHLERAADGLRALGVSTELRFRTAASPVEGILSEAGERDTDLIVVGCHQSGRGSFGDDNVTLQIVSGADRPVLVVPAEASL